MIGQSVSQYQITSKLGAGGMGEVYRARDIKLERDIALKLLPQSFASDQERLGRFEQEARTLASLNHPGIMVIHDSGIHNGSPYLISELLEGQTLRDLLQEGPLPPRKAVEYAVQIARALEAAHNKGIIHRDLKPENLFITRDDRVKVLDFGLAKLRVAAPATPASARPTIVGGTAPGIVLGTPGYMSPEQARGEEAESRSDIFALGAILYEMLSGQRAFKGESGVELMNAIIKSEPPELSAHSPNIPPTLERIVRRCLEKRPGLRFQTAADLAFALENSISMSGSAVTPRQSAQPHATSVPRAIRWAAALMTALIVGAMAFGAFGYRWRPAPTTPAPVLRKLAIDLSRTSQTDGSSGEEITALAIAPDGKKFAYVNQEGLWLYWLDRLSPPVLLVKAAAKLNLRITLYQPFWSPHSDEVGYFYLGKMFRIPVTGGEPRLIATMPEFAASYVVSGGAWLPDGRIFFTIGSAGLYEVPAIGGEYSLALPIAEDEQDYHNACALPDGRGVLFVVHRANEQYDTIAVWTPRGAKKVLVQIPDARLWGPTYSPSGHVVFERLTAAKGVGQQDVTVGIWAFPFSLEKLERTGEAFLAVQNASFPSASADGALVYTGGSAQRQGAALKQMVWVDRTGRVVETLGAPTLGLTDPRLSPDQRQIAVILGNGGNGDLFIFDIGRGSYTSLTHTPDYDGSPFWFPDSSRVLFSRRTRPAAPSFSLVKAVDGFGEAQELGPGKILEFSRSGKYVFTRVPRSTHIGTSAPQADAWAWRELDGKDTQLHPFPAGLDPVDVALSPDDRVLAYSSSENGRSEVYTVSFPSFTNRTRISHNGGCSMQWNPNGSELIYLSPDRQELWAASVTRDPSFRLEKAVKLCDLPESTVILPVDPAAKLFQVSADGQRFLMIQTVATEQPTKQKPAAFLVENWFEEFRRK
jgi:hypothetical protein